jgi:uncharacterized protein (TIGR03067 family)
MFVRKLMKTATLVLAMLMLPVAAWAVDDATAVDAKRMQGDWMVERMRVDGMDLPALDAQALFRTVQGDRYAVSRYAKVIGQGTFKLDATKSPKTIDSTPAPKPGGKSSEPPKPIRGIYEFDGDRMRICNSRPGQPRPKNFEAKRFTGHTLIVWEPEVK